MNDMSSVIVPKSDQINADDLIAGPLTFTIREVRISPGSEQPVNIVLDGTDKFYRPCKSMSRVLVGAWGADAKAYVGRSLTLYRDPEVKWGGMAVGGIRISHMSDIDGAKVMVLTATKGSRKPHKVMPLADAPKTAAKPASKSPREKAEDWVQWLRDEMIAAPDAAKAWDDAKTTLARMAKQFPDLHADAMKLAPATDKSAAPADPFTDDPAINVEFTATIASIKAAPDIEAVDRIDANTDAHRAFLTDAQCDELDDALATKRAELRVDA